MKNLCKDDELMKLEFGRTLVGQEQDQLLISNPFDSFAIYQLGVHEKTEDLRFMPMDYLKKHNLQVERSNYELVYTAALPNSGGKEVPALLNDLFFQFNHEHPKDFEGHSLSVSDVVALKVSGQVSVHYVDRWGWEELNGFLADNPLKNAEMLLEDDYGMIDGILNNGKRDPEKERPSVAEQLRTPVNHKPKAPGKPRKNEPGIE